MTNCPFCDGENIEGADQCRHCEQPLEFLSQRVPQAVQREIARPAILFRKPIELPTQHVQLPREGHL